MAVNHSDIYELRIGGRLIDDFTIINFFPSGPGKPIAALDFRAVIGKNREFPNLDLKDDVELFKKDSGHSKMFGGYVDNLAYAGETAVFRCKGAGSEFANLKISYEFLNGNPLKMLYFTARLAFKKEKLHFEQAMLRDMDLTEKEYVVITPVLDLIVREGFKIGDVVFYSSLDSPEDHIIRKSRTGRREADWNGNFIRAKVIVKATNFYDAIMLGYQMVSKAVDMIAFRSDLSFPKIPTVPELLGYDNLRYYSQITLTDHIFCKEKNSDMACLFNMRIIENTALNLENDADRYLSPVIRTFGSIITKNDAELDDDERMISGSLRWLRVANNSIDPTSKLLNLWLSLEFATSGIEVERMFTSEEIEAIKVAAAGVQVSNRLLTEDQLRALATKIDSLNDAPLLARIRKFVTEKSIAFSDSEFDLIKSARTKRNDVVHGKENVVVEREELAKLKTLIERILIAKLAVGNS